MSKISFEERIDKILSLILSIPNLSLQAKIALFIVEDNVLVMKASRGLEEIHIKECREIPIGKCLCGLAVSTKELIFTDCKDHHHIITCNGALHHGHYCVPIISDNNVLGVINLYIRKNYKRDKKVEKILLNGISEGTN